jgi:hypothetical protein
MLSRRYILSTLLMALLVGCHPPQTQPHPLTDLCHCPSGDCSAPCINYVVGDSGLVRLVVYDTSGHVVDTMGIGPRRPGQYCATWSMPDSLPSGVYFLRVIISDSTAAKKIVVVQPRESS